MANGQGDAPSSGDGKQGRNSALRRLWGAIKWFFQQWKLIATVVVLIAFIFPATYSCTVKRLPKAYYYVGTLKHRPNGQPWIGSTIGLSRIEGAPRTDRLNAFLATSGDTATLDAPNYIPAKAKPTYAESNIPSRQWDGGVCLYIADPVIVPAFTDRNDNVLPAPATLDRRLHRRAFDQVCQFGAGDPANKTCPAYALWLHGTPVPCSLISLVPRFMK